MIKVALVQLRAFDVTQGEKALEVSLEMIDKAAKINPQLIVLPECTYPGYFLGYNNSINTVLAGLQNALEMYRAKAKEHNTFIAVGAPEVIDNAIYNSAYLINNEGEIIGTARKSFLWHFDGQWFSTGDDYEVFDTPLGRIGMIVCADGRQPEISRILALKGAQIIIDVTNWVTGGSVVTQLNNPQYEYFIPCRALENKVWFLAANKVGQEAESILYCGKSCAVSPRGEKIISATSHEEEVISCCLDVNESDDKNLNSELHLFNARKSYLYGIISEGGKPPIADVLEEKIRPGDTAKYVSTVQLREDITSEELLNKMENILKVLSIQGSSLVVFPEVPCLMDRAKALVIEKNAREMAKKYCLYVIVPSILIRGADIYKVSYLIDPQGYSNVYEKCHLDNNEENVYTSGQELKVFATPFGNIGLIMGYEGLLPEVSRTLMLKGADLVCWSSNIDSENLKLIARTRSAENKIYHVVSGCWGKREGASFITNPAGNIISSSLPQGDQLVSAQIELCLARCKTVVPGSNIVANRLPQYYRTLTDGL